MHPIRHSLSAICLVGLLASPRFASAHDIVIFPEWNGSAITVDVKFGHPQDYQPIEPDKLYRFEATTPGGDVQNWRAQLRNDAGDLRMTREPTWRLDGGIALLAGAYDNGYWSKDRSGVMVNTSRVNDPGTSVASHNLKYGKAFVATGSNHAGFDRVVGQKLELIPLADPLALKVGDLLPVAVRFNGKPLVGAGVEIGDSVTAIEEDRIPRHKTDAGGVARVPIGKSGWQVVGVDHEERSPHPKLADKEKYTATMVFRLP